MRRENSEKPYKLWINARSVVRCSKRIVTGKMNRPSASHAGGVWEEQIRTIRSVLTALLDGNAGVLDGETFQTLICEAEAIVNSRLLTLDNLSDPDSLAPLMLNHILTMKTWPVLPPPGVFQREDQYSRKHGDESSTPPQPSNWRCGDC